MYTSQLLCMGTVIVLLNSLVVLYLLDIGTDLQKAVDKYFRKSQTPPAKKNQVVIIYSGLPTMFHKYNSYIRNTECYSRNHNYKLFKYDTQGPSDISRNMLPLNPTYWRLTNLISAAKSAGDDVDFILSLEGDTAIRHSATTSVHELVSAVELTAHRRCDVIVQDMKTMVDSGIVILRPNAHEAKVFLDEWWHSVVAVNFTSSWGVDQLLVPNAVLRIFAKSAGVSYNDECLVVALKELWDSHGKNNIAAGNKKCMEKCLAYLDKGIHSDTDPVNKDILRSCTRQCEDSNRGRNSESRSFTQCYSDYMSRILSRLPATTDGISMIAADGICMPHCNQSFPLRFMGRRNRCSANISASVLGDPSHHWKEEDLVIRGRSRAVAEYLDSLHPAC